MGRRTVQLRVGGASYRVVTSASDEDLQRLVAVVDEKLATVVPPGRAVTPQAMLLAAMALANDLAEERARGAALAGRFREAFGRILERVDAVLDAPGAPASNRDGASDRSP
jgi:cell division protein ZapA